MPFEFEGICALLQVFDMPTSVRFYRDLLGFEVFQTSPPVATDDFGWCWLKRNGTELMLNTAYDYGERPNVPDNGRSAGHSDICLYVGCPDVDAAYNYFCKKGIELRPPNVTHYGMKQLYISDPDGFGICFQWRA